MFSRYPKSTLASLAVAGACALIAATPPPASHTEAAPLVSYWGCSQGYDLQVQGDAVRCYKAQSTSTTPMNPCPNVSGIGLTASVDGMSGRRDSCSGVNPLSGVTAVQRTCPAGYSLQIRRGRDRCTKLSPPHSKAPSVQMNI